MTVCITALWRTLFTINPWKTTCWFCVWRCVYLLLIEGRSLTLYSYLYKSAHTIFELQDIPFYDAIQIIMVLSEISHSATYPLCSSVFRLLHYAVDVLFSIFSDFQHLSTYFDEPLSITNLDDFQNCLDRIQLLYLVIKIIDIEK